MAYLLSATKLQHYARCPRSYYYRYEYGLKESAAFGSAALGNALHQALASIYRDWHYHEALPPLEWLASCWQEPSATLSEKQRQDGWKMLTSYYDEVVRPAGVLSPPLAVEGRIDGKLTVEGVEFKLIGRYDRLDLLDEAAGGGIALIDYKSTKSPQIPSPETVDLQLGLYYLGLEQRYQQSLRRMSLLYLRSGQQVSFEASGEHKARVTTVISDLAVKLKEEETWQAECNESCEQCSYARYCPAITTTPEPLPERQPSRRRRNLQLSLGV